MPEYRRMKFSNNVRKTEPFNEKNLKEILKNKTTGKSFFMGHP